MKITKWITEAEGADKEERLGGMGGFFKEGMRWKDYLENYKKEAHPFLEELKTSIIQHSIRCTGEEVQNGAVAVPLWEDGKVSTYSWRGWGDLMAAVWSEHENKDYHYMDFYM